MLNIKLVLIRFILWLIKIMASKDKDYHNYRSFHMSPVDYPSYLIAYAQWKRLEKKYGSWAEVWANEPNEASRLELILA